MTKETAHIHTHTSKFVGYRVDIQKPVFFLYTNNVQLELKNTPFKMAWKKMEYFGINLAVYISDLCEETTNLSWKKSKIYREIFHVHE